MGELTATEQDIRNCYRLLLSREPDTGGLRYWRELVDKHRITVRDLANGFLVSDEFAALNTGQEAPNPLRFAE